MKDGNEVKLEWVKPKFERHALKDALGAGSSPQPLDLSGSYS